MRSNIRQAFLIVAALCLCFGRADAQYVLKRGVQTNGSSVADSSGGYGVRGTLGQAVAGVVSDPAYAHKLGFWQGFRPPAKPVATALTVTGLEDADLGILLSGTDEDGDALTAVVSTLPEKGVLYQTADGTTRGAQISVAPAAVTDVSRRVIYVPEADSNGTGYTTFGFRVNDGREDSEQAMVTVNLTAVNDAPTVTAIANPTAVLEDAGAQTVSLAGISTGATNESQALTVTAVSSRPGLIPNPTVSYASPAATGTLTYTPAADSSGTATITVVVKDDGGVAEGGVDSVTVSFAVTVAPVNDAPTVTAVAGRDTIDEDAGVQTATFLGIGSGAADESQALAVTAVSGNPLLVPHPSVSYTSPTATGTLTYTPVADANGVAVITLKVKDDGGRANGGVDSVMTQFEVRVRAIQDAPVAVDDEEETDEDAPTRLYVLPNDREVDGDPLTVTEVSGISGGSAEIDPDDGSVVFFPAEDFSGRAGFSYTISDGKGHTATARVTVNVAAVNDPPSAADDQAAVVAGQAVDVPVLGNDSDPDGDELTVASVGDAAHGSAAIQDGGVIAYTPAVGFEGEDTFTYTVSDGQGETAAGTVTVTVSSANQPPQIVGTIADREAGVNRPIALELAAHESDAEDAPEALRWTVSDTDPALIQEITGQESDDDRLTFVPVPGATGSDEVALTLTDSQGATATTRVTLTWAPLAVDFTASPEQGVAPQTVLFTIASAEDGQTYLWDFGDATSGAANESAEASPNHTYARFGDYTVSLKVTDAGGHTASKQKTIAIAAQVPVVTVQAEIAQGLGRAEDGQVTGQPPLTVRFAGQAAPDDVDLVGDLTYRWNFGDASDAAAQPNVEHTYETAGTYTAVLTVTGAGGEVKTPVAVQIKVNQAPGAFAFLTPGEDETGVALTPTLSWGASIDPDGDAVTYTVYLDSEPVVSGIAEMEATVGPLAQNTAYAAEVEATDGLGGVSPRASVRFTTIGDVQPPAFTRAPYATVLTPTSVLVQWQTDEASSSMVDYRRGADSDYLRTAEADAAGVTDHRVTLTELMPETKYVLRVISVDLSADRNEAVSEAFTVTLPPAEQAQPALAFTVEPTVLDRTPSGFVLYWETNRHSTTEGTVAGQVIAGQEGQKHTLVATGLQPDTEFVVTVRSAVPSEPAVTGQMAVSTLPAAQVALEPVLSLPGVVSAGPTGFTVAWETDVPASTALRYGLSSVLTVFQTATGAANVREHRVTVVGLTPNTVYYFRAVSSGAGGEGVSGVREARTAREVDTTPPVVVTGSAAFGVSQDRAVVEWTTDEPGDSRVEIIGPDGALAPAYDAELVLTHRVTVTGLQANTDYTLRVRTTNAVGLTGTGADVSIRTLAVQDVTSPVIVAGPAVLQRTPSSLTVAWETDEPAGSAVSYVPDDAAAGMPEQTRTLPAHVRKHQVSLTHLLPETVYRLSVQSTDPAGNPSEAVTLEVRTAAAPDETPPQVVTPPTVASVSDRSATIVWTTDEPANGLVTFGEAGGEMDGMRGDATAFGTDHSVTLTGLKAGTTYRYRVSSTDALGNGPTHNAGDLDFTTRQEADTRPAQIVARPAVLSVTQHTAMVSWTTDELADSRVDVAEGDALPSEIDGNPAVKTVVSPTFTRVHTVTVTGLKAGMRYAWRVGSQDRAGNDRTFEDGTPFVTLSLEQITPPPQILAGPTVVSATASSATLVWTTDAPTRALVDYGPNGFGDRVEEARIEQVHTLTLTGLSAETTYSYRVTSTDQSGKAVTTDRDALASDSVRVQRMDLNLTTLPAPDEASPVVVQGPIAEISGGNVRIFWETDEPATGTVFFGVRGVYGVPGLEQMQVQDEAGLSTQHTVHLRNLDLSTQFLYRAISVDANNNATNVITPAAPVGKPAAKMQPPGGDGQFVTSTTLDTRAPMILSGPRVAGRAPSELTILWETDEPANGRVEARMIRPAAAGKQAGEDFRPSVSSQTSARFQQVALTNLKAGTSYRYVVEVTDLSGNTVVSDTAYAVTAAEADVVPPRIVAPPQVIYKTDRSATIAWDLDEMGDGEVRYGTGGKLNLTRASAERSRTPTVTLTNLQPETVYTCRVFSRDQKKNGPTQSEALVFETDPVPDVTPPTILDDPVVSAVTAGTTTLRWQTDELSDSAVRYSVGSFLDHLAGSAEHVADHRITLTGLQPDTDYTFQVASRDRDRNGPTKGPVLSFRTASDGGDLPPAAPTGLTATAGGTETLLSWAVNGEADLIGYNVYRGVGEAALAPVATRVARTDYRDVNLTPGMIYRYAVSALDQGGNASDKTAAVTATPDLQHVPRAPSWRVRQGTVRPLLAVHNAPAAREDTPVVYAFQVSSLQDFSDIVSSASGIAEGSGTTEDGVTAWQVDRPLQYEAQYYWRARAGDGTFDGPFMEAERFIIHPEDADCPGDFDGDLAVGFTDFIAFAKIFNLGIGDAEYNPLCDLDHSGRVDFPDFVSFAVAYGTRYLPTASTKPVVLSALPEDRGARWTLQADAGARRPGATVIVRLQVADASALQGYGLSVRYDEDLLSFVGADEPEESLLRRDGRETGVFGVLAQRPGRVDLGSFVTSGSPANGAGALVALRFRLTGYPGGAPLVEIAEGIAAYADGSMRAIPGGGMDLLPDGPVLYRTYPNPFNAETVIEYGLREAAAVRLDIYNALGQRVVRLVGDRHEGGIYSVRWDGKDRLGRAVASGIYIVRMAVGAAVRVEKMLLLK